MNIITATMSGKRIKRKGETMWGNVNTYGFLQLTKEDILADDWEVEEEKFEVTEGEILEALRDYRFTECEDMYDIIQRLKSGGYK